MIGPMSEEGAGPSKSPSPASPAPGDGPSNFPPLAIVGIGALFPRCEDVTAFWAAVREGKDCITEVPPSHWSPEDYFDGDPKSPDRTYARRGGFLPEVPFAPLENGITPNTLDATDASQLLGLLTARRALEDAGYGAGSDRVLDRDRTSVILGVTGTLQLVIPLGARLGHPLWRRALRDAGVDDSVADDVVARIADGYVPWREDSFPGLLGNVVAGRIANRLDLRGTNCVVDAACASSLSALHLAAMELHSGRTDTVVTGGADTFNDIFMYMCFSKTPALSPTGDARPFAEAADGTILGEGLGMVVLKRLADAERDGDRIYAVVRGIGTSSDGRGEAIYAPTEDGQARCLRSAYESAGVSPASIDLVEAHGTGTKVGDAVELRALTRVYREHRAEGTWCSLGSVKSQIGHTKAAAGAAGLIKAAMALHRRVLPPSIKVDRPQEALARGETPFHLGTVKRPWLARVDGTTPRRAAVSAFGFGGSNFHCVLEEHGTGSTEPDWDGEIEIVPLGAGDRVALDAALAPWCEPGAAWNAVRTGAAAARAAFGVRSPWRLVLVLEKDRGDPASVASAARRLLQTRTDDLPWSTPDGTAHFGSGAPGLLGVLFPGQGSQYPGMLRDLACRFPEMLDALETADRAYAAGDGALEGRLSDRIHPPAAFDDGTRAAQEDALRDTRIAQPALGAVSLGGLRVLERFGVRFDVAAGHSYGELTALCAAGRFDVDALHRLSALRGRLMADGGGSLGGMLAVSAPLSEIEQVVREEALDVVLANRNAPEQAVLSGSFEALDRAVGVFIARSVAMRRLDVGAAFHSPLVARAREPMALALRDVALAPARVPVWSNTTAAVYPSDDEGTRALLAGQLAEPVEFVRSIEGMHASGVRTFLEVGPRARLGGLVDSILGDRPHACIALDASSGKRGGVADLARALARLAALGHPVDLAQWEEGRAPAPVPAGTKAPFVVTLTGANYRKPVPPRPPVARRAPQESSMGLPESNFVTPRPSEAADGKARGAQWPHGATSEEQRSQRSPQPAECRSYSRADPTLRSVEPGPAPATPSRGPSALEALIRLQEETAALHRQFLEGQDRARATLHALLAGTPMVAGPLAAAPAPFAPAPESRVPASAPVVQTPRSAAGVETVVAPRGASPAPVVSRAEVAPEAVHAAVRTKDVAVVTGGSATGHSLDAVAAALLAAVSEKTGYPVEMLGLDMGLDADLGIDSIKRVEILSSLQDRLPGLPTVKPDRMGALRTLGDIVALLGATAIAVPDTVVSHAGNAAVSHPATSPSIPMASSPTPAAPPAGALAADAVAAALLAAVAEKTGYPVEMLGLEMGLDSDLGIDSIKRVEILSALQDRLPGLPAVKPDRMGSLRTLGDIVALLSGGSGASAPLAAVVAPAVAASLAVAAPAPAVAAIAPPPPPAPSPPQPAVSPAPSPSPAPAAPRVAATPASDRSITRRVLRVRPSAPAAQRPPFTLAEGAPVWVAPVSVDDPLAVALVERLRSRGLNARVIAAGGPPPDHRPEALGGLVILAPPGRVDDVVVRNALVVLRLAAPSLRNSGHRGGALLATVSRMDGRFGLSSSGPGEGAEGGALAGFAKTARHEWTDVRCRAFDVASDLPVAAAAEALAEELLRDGPLETGITAEGSATLELVAEAPSAGETVDPILGPGELAIISGGARGVTAEVAVALARRFRCAMLLLGRSAPPEDVEEAWLRALPDEAAIKRALVERSGGKPSPRDIESSWRRIAASREIRSTLARIAEAGGTAIYRSVDGRDAAAVATAVREARSLHGPVRAVVHGAGVLADGLLEQKTPDQFDRVYGTKVAGLRALLAAAGEDDLRLLLVFSSTTARLGRRGQGDYAAANEALNKRCRAEAAARPRCRVLAMNYGPWEGGMVTPSLARLFEEEGVARLPLAECAAFTAAECAAPTPAPGPVEIVVLAGDAPEGDAQPSPAAGEPMEDVLDRSLDVEGHAILHDHVIDGRAVVPLALLLEWVAHAALHRHPGQVFAGVENLRVLKGVVLDAGQPVSVRVRAGRGGARADGTRAVPVEIVGVLPGSGRPVAHLRATALVAPKHADAPAPLAEPDLMPTDLSPARAYEEDLFHGPGLHAIDAIDAMGPAGIALHSVAAPPPSRWLRSPLRGSWLADPMVVDAALQGLIVWSRRVRGVPCLPTAVASYRQFRRAFPATGVRVSVRITGTGEHRAAADIDFLDDVGVVVARMEGVENVLDASLAAAFRRRTLES